MSDNGFFLNLNYAVAVLLVLLGLYAMIIKKALIKKVMGFLVMQSGVFLFLVAMGLVGSGETRVVTPGFRAATLVNPVPHALVLVGIMLSVGVTAFSLALIVRMRVVSKRDRAGNEDSGEDLP